MTKDEPRGSRSTPYEDHRRLTTAYAVYGATDATAAGLWASGLAPTTRASGCSRTEVSCEPDGCVYRPRDRCSLCGAAHSLAVMTDAPAECRSLDGAWTVRVVPGWIRDGYEGREFFPLE